MGPPNPFAEETTEKVSGEAGAAGAAGAGSEGGTDALRASPAQSHTERAMPAAHQLEAFQGNEGAARPERLGAGRRPLARSQVSAAAAQAQPRTAAARRHEAPAPNRGTRQAPVSRAPSMPPRWSMAAAKPGAAASPPAVEP